MRKFFAAMVLILVGLMVQACEQPKQDVKIVYQQPGTKGGGTVDDLNWQDIYRQSIMSVPKIEIWQCRVVANDCFQYGHGSGFVVADGVVATNWHVASYYNDIVWEQFPDEITYFKLVALYPAHNSLNGNEFLAQEYEVTGIFGDWSRDIAFLQVETLGRKHLPLTSTRWQNQQILDEVMAMGYPISYDFVATVGRITAILTNEDVGLGWVLYDTKLLKIDSQIDHGNSGGPLLNERGEVIGINFAGVAYATVTHNFALSADYLAVYDLDTLEFQGREVPSPSDYHTQVILDSAYYIDPSGSNYYLLSLKQNCLYKFVATGVDFIDPNPVIPVSTHFDLYRNGWWQTSGYPNMSDVYKSDILYRCDETANYDLNVYVETYFTNYPGWYNLKITEYCPIP